MNLIESLKSEIGTSVINQISEKVGVTTDQASSALNAGIPAVLAGILKNNDSLSGSGFLGNLLSNATGSLFNAEDTASGTESWLNKGKDLVGSIFGANSSAVTSSLASHIGLGEEKSSGLFAMILPLITGAIGKLVSKNGWSVTDLISKIWENKTEISSALPAGLSSSLSLANVNLPNVTTPHIQTPVVEVPKVDIPKAEVPKVETPYVPEPRAERPKVNYEPEANTSSSFLKWLIPLIIIGGLLWFFLGKGCNSDKVANVIDSTKLEADTALSAVKGKLNEAGDYIFDLGDTISKKLPDGKEISIGSNSVENKLISFIEDKDKAVDKETWFTFDRLYFETGKSTLKAESQEQLGNIAAILKAFPNVKLKLGGYTDNTGDAAVNKTISNERANTALKALVALGIDASRLEAEGYGAEHPIASNDTAEGKAQNRRIDVRVTSK
jgi:OOP family OmpA-OmpF porin